MVRITGAAVGAGGVALTGYGAAIVTVSLIVAAIDRADGRRVFALIKRTAIQARREDKETIQAMPRTEPQCYANPLKSLLTVG
ncbi:hypothetical protein [uncultured Bradyrhizobium sp.]|uniref:hypothetical protein n=1 Tax=uncultured Bradyrhizobium sp. TaxID=199684 RepID=UPI0035CB1D33